MKSVAEYREDLKELSVAEQADFWVITLEDGMDEAKETAFRFWLADSPEHRSAYNISLEVWRLAGKTTTKTNSVIENKAEKLSPLSPSFQRFHVAHWIAAGITVAVLSVFLFSDTILRSETITTAQTQTGFKTLPLADGSTARLAASSSLQIDFNEAARKIDLKKGGVFVDVKPNKNRPFSVTLGSLEVTAVGTAYSVEDTITGPLISVHEGVVRIQSQLDNHPPVFIKAGQSWTTESDLKSGYVRNSVVTKSAYWKKEQLQVENAKLGQILQKFSNYIGEEVIWLDPDLAKTEVSGLFQMRNSGQLLKIFENRYNFEKYSLFGRTAFIQKKS